MPFAERFQKMPVLRGSHSWLPLRNSNLLYMLLLSLLQRALRELSVISAQVHMVKGFGILSSPIIEEFLKGCLQQCEAEISAHFRIL